MRTTLRSVLAVSAAACALKAGTDCLHQDGSGVPKDKVVINSVTIAQG